MSELPVKEIIIFLSVVVLYVAAAIVGIAQLWSKGERYRRFLLPVVSLAVCLEAVLLIFRAVAIKAVPLTGLFESMIVLTIVFGLVFLFFSIAIKQVWFGSIMVWVILIMILMAAVVAEPASEAYSIASTPWAVAHGIAMVLSGALIIFATANAFLYLLSASRLKHKKVMKVLGRVPNIAKLKELTEFGLKGSFVLMTFGLASGFGLAVVQSTDIEMSVLDWLTDSKVVLIIASWVILALILLLHRLALLKDKATAYITMVLFFLILFAIIGTAVFCGTKHDFTRSSAKIVEVRE
ncbi:MAG: cytochrome c biogenesis protein CcsA [Planctomycetota bacterium]|jgi:ABC-type uncharacterized transport system permease subunit